MIRVIICGIAGRMGREILSCGQEADDINIIGGVEAPDHETIGKTIEGITVVEDLTSILPEADCVIEFTNAQSTVHHLRKNVTHRKAYVTGTTGFSKEDMDMIADLSKSFPVLQAPNMSIGVNHLYSLVKSSTRVLSGYDVEVVETHHRKKRDAPSGTAQAIVNIIQEQRPQTRTLFGREGVIGERPDNDLCVHAVRGGDVVGEHRIIFLGNGEFVELRHYATSRRCFAAGTLAAVRFITAKQSGLYSIGDMLT